MVSSNKQQHQQGKKQPHGRKTAPSALQQGESPTFATSPKPDSSSSPCSGEQEEQDGGGPPGPLASFAFSVRKYVSFDEASSVKTGLSDDPVRAKYDARPHWTTLAASAPKAAHKKTDASSGSVSSAFGSGQRAGAAGCSCRLAEAPGLAGNRDRDRLRDEIYRDKNCRGISWPKVGLPNNRNFCCCLSIKLPKQQQQRCSSLPESISCAPVQDVPVE